MARLCYSSALARVCTCLLVGCLAIVQIGCEDASQPAPRRSGLGSAGPEESFQRVLARLKRRLEQGPRQVFSSGLDADSNETSSFSLQDTVTGKLLPPEQEGQPYRAEVIIRTNADYVHTRTIPDPTIDKPQDDDGVDSVLSLLEQDGESGEVEDPLLSPELSLSEDSLGGPSGDDITASQAKPGTQTLTDRYGEVNRYMLIHRDGRWALEEPIGAENEDSSDEDSDESDNALQLIFDYALEGQ